MSPSSSLALEIVLEGKCCHGRRGNTLHSTPTSMLYYKALVRLDGTRDPALPNWANTALPHLVLTCSAFSQKDSSEVLLVC